MRKWLKRLKGFFRFRKAKRMITAHEHEIRLSGESREIKIPLHLTPEWKSYARTGKKITRGKEENREEVLFHSTSHGYEIEKYHYESGKLAGHHTYEYDVHGNITRAIISISRSGLKTYVFEPRNGELKHVSTQKL